MARVEFLPDVFEDLQRIADHLERYDAGHVQARLGEVISAFDVLVDNPLIGCPWGEDQSELVIGRGSRGHVALYRYVPLIDTVSRLPSVRDAKAAIRKPSDERDGLGGNRFRRDPDRSVRRS